jgi:hypothetical protein
MLETHSAVAPSFEVLYPGCPHQGFEQCQSALGSLLLLATSSDPNFDTHSMRDLSE